MDPKTGRIYLRYPDFVNEDILKEVKNVNRQGLTVQLKDYIHFTKEKNIPMELYIRDNTKLSQPLQKAIVDNKIDVRYLNEKVLNNALNDLTKDVL